MLVHDAHESCAERSPGARHARCAAHVRRALARVAEGVERDGPGRDGDPWRSTANAGARLRVRAYLATLRQQDRPVLPAIVTAPAGRPWLPATTPA